MQRQVAIGAVVGFALTVIFLSVCDVRMSAPGPAVADASVAQAPAPVAAPVGLPKKPVEQLQPSMLRPGANLRRPPALLRLPSDGGH